MRVRAVVVLSLITLALSIGCRNALSPNIDRDRAPETWITAAPPDTVSVRNRDGTATPPKIYSVPTRFHLYWAGSDADGTVVGFYWAVVETLPQPAEGTSLIPPLPGPRASQYRFTTKTDSIFSFNVSEFSPDRQHAFYIYAVDDKGKGDPTPARFIFNALDRFPPLPVFDVSAATGKHAIVSVHGTVTLQDVVVPITDSLVQTSGAPPKDTIPAQARIDFVWHGEPTITGNYAVRYKYKLDEPAFVVVDSSVHRVSYNTGVGNDRVTPGTKVFTLRAIDAAGGARSGSQEVTRYFQVNEDPITWFAGPDSNLIPLSDNYSVGRRYQTMPSWTNFPSGGGSLLSCDSLYYWPSERQERKTFWEIYSDKLFLRAENDTVDMNGIIVVQPGGRDYDSDYRVNVNANFPDADTVTCSGEIPRALRPSGQTGSPIGFRFLSAEVLSFSTGLPSQPSPSALFPFLDAASTGVQRKINGYTWFTQSGRVAFILRSVDGDGAQDSRLPDAYNSLLLADGVDSGSDTDPYDVALRRQAILTFYVNRAPYFDVGSPLFKPKPPQYNGGANWTEPDRVLRLNLLSKDPDPYDPSSPPNGPGGPSASTVLRTRVTVRGTDASGVDTSYTAPVQFVAQYNIDLPTEAPYITGRNLRLTIQLCDCANCEQTPGTGRCVNFGPIPVDVGPAVSTTSFRGSGPIGSTGTKSRAASSGSIKP